MSSMEQELVRILWRQRVLATPDGVAWLTDLVRRGVKERDLGPWLESPASVPTVR